MIRSGVCFSSVVQMVLFFDKIFAISKEERDAMIALTVKTKTNLVFWG